MAETPSTSVLVGVSPKPPSTSVPIGLSPIPSSTSVHIGLSPKPSSTCDLSNMEQGKTSPSQESTVTTINSPTIAHKVIAELMGTYIIMFAGCGSVLVDYHFRTLSPVGMAIVWGLVVLVMIYTLGHVSGAHFNPAVTIAFAISHKFPWNHVAMYVGSQVLGSTLAILSLKELFNRMDICETRTKFTKPTNNLEALTWEFAISFFLMFVICGVATDHRAINELSGVAVGATVLFNVLIAGQITGASMNPARSIGPAIVCGNLDYLWIYIVAPILGMIAATLIYCLLRLPLPDKVEKEGTKCV